LGRFPAPTRSGSGYIIANAIARWPLVKFRRLTLTGQWVDVVSSGHRRAAACLLAINSLTGIIKQACPTRPYLSGVKHKYLYVAIVLAILGIAVIGVSMTMPYSNTKTILGIVLGGVLIQAGIATFVIDWSEVRRPAHRRRRR
jgi:hypothetical protein